jgi:hypothetical protein
MENTTTLKLSTRNIDSFSEDEIKRLFINDTYKNYDNISTKKLIIMALSDSNIYHINKKIVKNNSIIILLRDNDLYFDIECKVIKNYLLHNKIKEIIRNIFTANLYIPDGLINIILSYMEYKAYFNIISNGQKIITDIDNFKYIPIVSLPYCLVELEVFEITNDDCEIELSMKSMICQTDIRGKIATTSIKLNENLSCIRGVIKSCYNIKSYPIDIIEENN